MTTITIWLLIATSITGYRGASVPHVVERFATVQDCEHVARNMPKGSHTSRCIEAKVVRP